jgi:flagellar biosynthesis GTPase FlhF
MRQYEELTAMITSIQAAMDNVATVLEQILGVLSWREPRVTFFAMCFLMLSSVGYYGGQTFVEMALRFARSVGTNAVVASKSENTRVGKAVVAAVDFYEFVWRAYLERPYDATVAFVDETTESFRAFFLHVWGLFTLKAILKASRLVFSLYMLYALRHPAILPDQSAQFKSASKSVEVDEAAEAKKKAEAEAAAAAEAEAPSSAESAAPEKKKSRAELEAEAERERRRAARAAKKEARRKQKEKEEAEKKAKAAGASAIDRRPPAPLNAFSRIPSRGYQIL